LIDFERPDDHLAPALPADDQRLNLREHVEEMERALIERTLAAVGGNQSEAARRLGVSRGALLGRLRKYAPPAS
jgi:two-component system, NtrC family, response regulator AtoC